MGEGLVDKLQREPDLDIQVTWLPFELHPEIPLEGVDIATYLTISPAQVERRAVQLRARAAELGLPLGQNQQIVNTHKALLLAEWARQEAHEQWESLHRALFQTYFVENGNLANEAVLQAICAKVGLPSDEALAHLADPPFERRLTESMLQAQGYGINGVPTFVINSRYKIVGAQPYHSLLQSLRKMAAELG